MPLLKQTLAKIKNNSCRGILLAPVTPGADWWPILEEATIDRRLLPRCTDLFLSFRKVRKRVPQVVQDEDGSCAFVQARRGRM